MISKEEFSRQRILVGHLVNDARDMAKESGVDETVFCSLAALHCMIELMVNGRDSTIRVLLADFFHHYSGQSDTVIVNPRTKPL